MRTMNETAYRLLHDGCKALARIEANGIRVDMGYLESTTARLDKEIEDAEKSLRGDKVWRRWVKRYKDKANLGSLSQMAEIVFEDMGYPVTDRTETGRAKADEAAFEKVDLQFVRDHIKMRKLQKIRHTYLEGIRREVVNGYLHPFFDLYKTKTYRSSSSYPNFQNIPTRNPEMKKIIRPCFIPRKGRRFVERDYSAIEVRVAYCYHKDPTMRKYLLDKTTDMHRDTAADLFGLKHNQVSDMARHIAKNKFVFPQFYGSYYVDCAQNIWGEVNRFKVKVEGTDELLTDWMSRKQGIDRLGRCDPDRKPVKGSFEYRVKEVEDSFWNDRFSVYTSWKKQWYKRYLDRGYFETLTGFVIGGSMRRNEVINYPVQGSAFHCLLASLIEIDRRLREYKMESLLVGQIHDSDLGDVPEDELQDYCDITEEVMTKWLPKQWDWLIIPLETGLEVTPVDGSWLTKQKWTHKDDVWQLKV